MGQFPFTIQSITMRFAIVTLLFAVLVAAMVEIGCASPIGGGSGGTSCIGGGRGTGCGSTRGRREASSIGVGRRNTGSGSGRWSGGRPRTTSRPCSGRRRRSALPIGGGSFFVQLPAGGGKYLPDVFGTERGDEYIKKWLVSSGRPRPCSG